MQTNKIADPVQDVVIMCNDANKSAMTVPQGADHGCRDQSDRQSGGCGCTSHASRDFGEHQHMAGAAGRPRD